MLGGSIFAGESSPDHITHSKHKLARHTTTFGTLGIVAGQTVRLSAIRQPDEDQGVRVCRVDLNIFDIHGNRQAAVSGNLDPGKGLSVDLARADIVPPPNEALAQLNAVVDVTSNSKDGKPGCPVAMSTEIFDQADGLTPIYAEIQGAFSAKVDDERNLSPVGSKAGCWLRCSLEDASCPSGLECWGDPITGQYLCCNGRPLASFVPVN